MPTADPPSHSATPISGPSAPPAAARQRAQATAYISIDIDPIDTHLEGYGFAGNPPCDAVYRIAVPRLLDLLDRVGVRATLFVVARDAAAQAPLLREVLRRGHEVASHSVTHPIPFADLPAAELNRQLLESRQRLEEATGGPILGFRAPGWDAGRGTLEAIAAAGYCYDASILPTPALLAGAALRFVLSGGRMRPHGLGRSLRAAFSSRRPYQMRAARGLWVFPIAVSPVFRLPFTHTLWYMAPRAICLRTYRAMRRPGVPLSYMLHAADALTLDDGIDARMGRHPGMQLPLDQKLALLEERLRAIAGDFRATTYAEDLAPALPVRAAGPRDPGPTQRASGMQH